ncbi:hypothetical protein DRQ32_02620 [bacterium]|nr:MAG: hypothetical protein DRQ32_02620 [bacterium]
MAHIRYAGLDEVPEQYRVDDDDNILRIHWINPPVLEQHYGFYRKLMYGKSPLTRAQREMIAVVVSAANECHY